MQHRVNDTAILDATVSELARSGWNAVKTSEREVEQGRLPVAALYLNMCQGSLAAEQLMPLESDGAVVVNRPSSALNCHRYRLVKRPGDSTLSFPRTLILASSAPLSPEQVDAFYPDDRKVWIKRGGVQAERPEDVVATSRERIADELHAFTARGIPWVALQEHVPGPIVKFYGVTDGRFFRWYGSDAGLAGERPKIDENRLKALAFEAAAILGLEVFGGDVAFPEPDRPVLIDINDWPSFAPVRAAAPDRPNSRRQLHDRAPRGAGPAAGGARARRLEPDAILFERCGGGGGSAPPGEVAHRAYRGPGILGRLPRQDRRRAPRARRELQARARAAHAGRLSLTLRGVRALRLRQDLSVVRMALRGVPQAEGGARDHQGRGGDHRRADPGHGGQCRAAARLPPGIASPRG